MADEPLKMRLLDGDGAIRELTVDREAVDAIVVDIIEVSGLPEEGTLGRVPRAAAIEELRGMGVEVELGELEKAARTGDIDTLRLLLNAGVYDRPKERRYQRTCLHEAAQARRLPVVQELMRWGGDPTLCTPPEVHAQNAMHFAAIGGNMLILKYFIAMGVPFDTPDGRGFTPFLLAVKNVHVEAAAFLYECGARLNAKTDTGQDALMIVNEMKLAKPQNGAMKTYITKLFKSRRAPVTPIDVVYAERQRAASPPDV